MKKLSALFLAFIMVMASTSSVFAAETDHVGQKAADAVKRFKAIVKLDDAMYKVHYTKQTGDVKLHVKNEEGHEKWTLTKEEAIDRVKTFVENLNWTPAMSKAELVDRLREALDVEAEDVEHVKASVAFTNGSKVGLNYHQGNKEVEQPWALERFQLELKGEDGYKYKIKYFEKKKYVMAHVKKTTEEGTETYYGMEALKELKVLKEAITNKETSNHHDYKKQLAEVLGVELTDINKFDLKVRSESHAKLHVSFKK